MRALQRGRASEVTPAVLPQATALQRRRRHGYTNRGGDRSISARRLVHVWPVELRCLGLLASPQLGAALEARLVHRLAEDLHRVVQGRFLTATTKETGENSKRAFT